MAGARGRVMFLFGAGASFGAGGILPEAPPLGGQLFEVLANLYRGSWGCLPWEIAEAFSANFEVGMSQVFEKYGPVIPQLMREMAIFFAQFRPFQKSSLYCRLVRDLAVAGLLDRVAFSTLNYECVLEFSLLEHGIGVDYFGEGSSKKVPVWKLHGSCNMFSHQVQASQGIMYGTGVIFEGGIEAFFDTNLVMEKCLVGTGLAPVMSLYMAGKPLAVSPSSIRELQELWRRELGRASAVVCVGVRPHPPDTHIWQPLAETPATVYFVGSEAEFRAWSSTARANRSAFLGPRFGPAYQAILEAVAAHAAH